MRPYTGPYVTWMVGFTRAEFDNARHTALPTDNCIDSRHMPADEMFERFKYRICKVVVNVNHESYSQTVTEYLIRLPHPDCVTFHKYHNGSIVEMDRVEWEHVTNQSDKMKFRMSEETIRRLKRYHNQEQFIKSVNNGFHSHGVEGYPLNKAKTNGEIVEKLSELIDEVAGDPVKWLRDRGAGVRAVRDMFRW